MKIRLPHNNWHPRPHQLELWHYLEGGGKRAIEIAHRRWGKDDVALHWGAISAIKKPATYWHMLPEYSQARKAIWNAVNPHTGIRRIDEAFPMEIRENTNETEMFIRFRTGSTWQVVGSDSYKALVGTPPYGITISEWAKADPAAWAYLSPILEENGGWALFITTPEGKNHAYNLYKMALKNPLWFAEKQTVEDTGYPLERVHQATLEYHALYGIEAGDALIQQEYYCSFEAAILGSVYGACMMRAEKAGRIGKVGWDPELPVHTAWDLGYDDATAILFWQVIYGEVRFIDYYEMNGQDVKHYCDKLKEKPYRYGNHYVPHDAANKLLAAGGRSIVEQMAAEGIRTIVIPATTQQNQIEAARKMLEKAWFDDSTEQMQYVIEAFRQYQFEYDENKKIFKSTPKHDWSSHPADALEIVGIVWHTPPVDTPAPAPKYLHDMTADDLFWGDKSTKVRHERY